MPNPPKKSLLEEEFHKEEAPILRPTRGAENNPLHPPGFVSPYKSQPWALWLLMGIGVAIAAFVVIMTLIK